MLNKKNIVLIGFMGSGKTTVGKILSKTLNFSLLDTDELIEKEYNEKISNIFKIYGEKYFRTLEYNIFKRLKKADSLIISTGGGFPIFIEKKNSNLKEIGTIFYLKASPTTLFKRVSNSKNRPLLKNFFLLFEKRKKIYENLADYSIETDYLLPNEIAFKIGRIYENCCR